MVKLPINAMGYSATWLKYSHSTVRLAFSLPGFRRPTGITDSAAFTCSSSRYVCFTAENLAMAVFRISFTRLKYVSSSKSESLSSSQVLVSSSES